MCCTPKITGYSSCYSLSWRILTHMNNRTSLLVFAGIHCLIVYIYIFMLQNLCIRTCLSPSWFLCSWKAQRFWIKRHPAKFLFLKSVAGVSCCESFPGHFRGPKLLLPLGQHFKWTCFSVHLRNVLAEDGVQQFSSFTVLGYGTLGATSCRGSLIPLHWLRYSCLCSCQAVLYSWAPWTKDDLRCGFKMVGNSTDSNETVTVHTMYINFPVYVWCSMSYWPDWRKSTAWLFRVQAKPSRQASELLHPDFPIFDLVINQESAAGLADFDRLVVFPSFRLLSQVVGMGTLRYIPPLPLLAVWDHIQWKLAITDPPSDWKGS